METFHVLQALLFPQPPADYRGQHVTEETRPLCVHVKVLLPLLIIHPLKLHMGKQ